MTFPVAGVDAKLRGAENRLRHLIEPIERGAVTDLLEMWTDRDRQGRVRVRVKELAEPPDEWHVWIGECVHDIRSALDNLAYALNVVGSDANPPPNAASSQFPLFTRRDGVKGHRGYRDMLREGRRRPEKCMVGFFPRGARTVIERMQPYHRRHNNVAGWLGVLGELSRIDKHRRFPLTDILPLMLQAPWGVEGHRVTDAWMPYRALKPNTTIMRLVVPTLPPSVKQPKVNFAYAMGLYFHGKAADPAVPLILPYEPVNFVLPSVLENVRNLVLPKFAPFFEGADHELIRDPVWPPLRTMTVEEALASTAID